MTAKQRVAAFLLHMAPRGSGGNEIGLPMSCQDIADYLGMTIETVSRSLRMTGRLASRRIVLRNRAALTTLNA